MTLKGMLVNVFRSDTDCTNGGITSCYNHLVLVGAGIPEIFEANDEMPALILKVRYGRLYAEPAEDPEPGRVGWMFGGNFVYSSDSRFPCAYPIPVHDRQE